MTITAEPRHGLGARLAALTRVVDLGQGREDADLLTEATQLIIRAGNRLKLVARPHRGRPGRRHGQRQVLPVQRHLGPGTVAHGRPPPDHGPHPRVRVGPGGRGPLLDWLQIQWRHRFSRSSALDKDDGQLHGLILMDLPDHDSIRALTDTEADRLITAADLIVWVLDPQKYADASTHRRYVTELAGHDAVTVFALNQADKLTPEEVEECLDDLRAPAGPRGRRATPAWSPPRPSRAAASST